MDTDQNREARLRRALHRNGLALVKTRRRTPEWIANAPHGVIDPKLNAWVLTGPNGCGYSLGDVEDWMTDRASAAPAIAAG